MKRLLGGLLVAQLVLGCSPAAPPPTPTPTPAAATPASEDEARKQAIVAVNNLMNSGDLDAAVALATKSLEKYPGSYELLGNRASIELHQKKFEAAGADFTAALKTAPESSRWTLYSQLGRCQMGLRQASAAAEKSFAEATRLMKEAKDVDPTFREQLWRLRAENLANDLRYKEAIPCYTEALKLAPDNLATLAGRAVAYSEAGDKKGFEADLATLAKANPEAAKEVRELAQEPKSADDRLARQGTLKLRQGDFEGALALLDQAVKANSKNAQAHQKRGSALQSLKRFPEAIEAYNTSYELDHNEVALFNRAICKLNESQFEEAQQDLEAFVKISQSPETIQQANSILEKLRAAAGH